MTKEEKDRRFLFDLNMGVFKTNDDGSIVFYDFYDNISDIETILAFNGYSQKFSFLDENVYGYYEYGKSKRIIKIYNGEKYFQCYDNISIRSLPHSKEISELPEYIKDYVISHNCKKYTIGGFYV